MDPHGYYSVLGIKENANDEEVSQAYKLLALKFHPDRNKSAIAHDMMVQINEAYEVLSDYDKRMQYEKYGFNTHTERYASGDVEDYYTSLLKIRLVRILKDIILLTFVIALIIVIPPACFIVFTSLKGKFLGTVFMFLFDGIAIAVISDLYYHGLA
jgi:hypothetical protein